ncbi:DUF317 domain-containing protein [Streptomyces luomodiensis]|uniref:DUF317 domain-containing protein n=1 Tax=Streptomyces luomodiensis TaxID=3026192 RepID=A0ABY9UUD3_9ACTN|nr:DUF317 domain-containing protein [Streptomyces sp. SCA4-21]WNE95490.1 DUF317 domain-containing protein [Streptomyces sp. SCA4-21]
MGIGPQLAGDVDGQGQPAVGSPRGVHSDAFTAQRPGSLLVPWTIWADPSIDQPIWTLHASPSTPASLITDLANELAHNSTSKVVRLEPATIADSTVAPLSFCGRA